MKRHTERGTCQLSLKEIKAAEDLTSRAGARNTFELIESWPEYVTAMTPVKDCPLAAIVRNPELQNLAGCCGTSPQRSPPPSSIIDQVRSELSLALGLTAEDDNRHHISSPWRYNLVRNIVGQSQDPAVQITDWLQHGAPCGLTVPIIPGGLLPPVQEEPEMLIEELEQESL